jgi:hypothetical protein
MSARRYKHNAGMKVRSRGRNQSLFQQLE